MTKLKLLQNVHENLEVTNTNTSKNCYKVCGTYEYYHYDCDGFDDRGWGCGYRTLQTICSWLNYNSQRSRKVPSIREIQETLVQIGDKPNSFIDSRQWIGSVEVGYVIDQLYDIPCKIHHLTSGDELIKVVGVLKDHFEKFGSPVMMGGDMDCSSKGVMGVHIGKAAAHLLIVDPHYFGKEQSTAFLQNKGWVKWQPLTDFLSTSFYNLCLPQVRSTVMESK